MAKERSVLIGRRQDIGGGDLRRSVRGSAGPTQLILLATDCGRPDLVKRAAFHFPSWAAGEEAFDTLAMIAGIVQLSCEQVEERRPSDWKGRSSHRERSRGAARTMVAGGGKE